MVGECQAILKMDVMEANKDGRGEPSFCFQDHHAMVQNRITITQEDGQVQQQKEDYTKK